LYNNLKSFSFFIFCSPTLSLKGKSKKKKRLKAIRINKYRNSVARKGGGGKVRKRIG